jgi:hypothetical protein
MYVEAIEAAAAAWEHRGKVAAFFATAANLIRYGSLKVLIFGPGGVGKSTLGRLLANGRPDELGARTYAESLTLENYGLPNNLAGTILVPPGQASRRSFSWGEALSELSGEGVALVINVVAYGFHSFENVSYTETKSYSKSMNSVAEFMRKYLEEQRAEEIDIIKNLTPFLQNASKQGCLRMVTLTTKQDLWWAARDEVARHYMGAESAYASHIREIQQARGTGNFQHEYLSASLTISNFRAGDGVLLASTTAGYDEALQQANLRRVNEAISKLMVP